MIRAATALAAVALLAGCAIVPTATARSACDLLDIAMDEAQMAEAWYTKAGKVLEACGVPGAAERARLAACRARQFDDTSVECPSPPDLPRPETTKPEAS